MEKYLILGMNGVGKSYLLSRLLNKNEFFFGSGFVTHSLNGKLNGISMERGHINFCSLDLLMSGIKKNKYSLSLCLCGF